MKNYPRILVIANNCFSLSNSNGRTLSGFLKNWPKDKLAQFCLSLSDVDYNVCINYYCVTDRDALNAFSHITKRTKRNTIEINSNNAVFKSPKKTVLSIMIRNIIWDSGAWKRGFQNWVENFDPQLVLFQSGDSIFMSKIALNLAKMLNIPLVIFNTEAYYLFERSWFPSHWSNGLLFPIFRFQYRNQFIKMMRYASHTIYCNELLRKDYGEHFDITKSSVLYTSSLIDFEVKPFSAENPTFSYLGNLGLNRPLALIEIGEALSEVNSNYVLDVYGKLPSTAVDIFKNHKSIRYHGLVPYDKVIDVIKSSDILFHTEYNKGKWIKSLKYAFSTKIADSLASGKNFLLYAPKELACSKYIIDNNCAWFVEDKKDLAPTIRELIFSKSERQKRLFNANDIVEKNHNPQRNEELFNKILNNAVHKSV